MKMKGFKKFFVSIGLSTILTLSCASTVFAATAELKSADAAIEQSTESTELPQIENDEADAAGSNYLGSSSGIKQIAAATNNVTIRWNSVYGASSYRVYISSFEGSSYRLLGNVYSTSVKITNLSAGTAYTFKIYALNSAGSVLSYRLVDCTTLYKKPKVASYAATSSGYAFTMKAVTPVNSITGYKVVYQSSKTHKKITKYFNSRYFNLSLAENTFYQVKIYPYLTLNGVRYVSNSPTTKYVSRAVVLKKGGNTNTSMTVKWDKVYGADSYTIYIQYPGSRYYTKVRTTTSRSFTLYGMRRYYNYGIKVIANKKMSNTNWKSATKDYTIRLY